MSLRIFYLSGIKKKTSLKQKTEKRSEMSCFRSFPFLSFLRSSPRCRTSHTSVWGRSHRSDSRDHSPCSRCRARSGRSVDQLRWEGSDTDHCCHRSDSRQMMDSWRDRCPAGYKHTLWTRTSLHQDLSRFFSNG